ncbi:ShlB/FhaC/HecB family hemolysin secretion/activation protein [Flavobacterium sp. UBA6135]|uniref:ShlB/FhaC/HecB family hemolysin secretion/activation protein n=1 Tax=Flavobacterium sp. UBA6135 TaxID=1946553 RepID=UPI0025C43783|nr:ShlB/FhaC/HecB family hemolysin secretion/activation protein [Flavobacterium sp. UBA6135]
MKPLLYLTFCLLLIENCFSQSLYLKIEGNSNSETQIIDSIGYPKKFKTANEIITASKNLSNQLFQIGYFEHQIAEPLKANDSTFYFKYNLKNNSNTILLHIKDADLEFVPLGFKSSSNQFTIETKQLQGFMEELLKKLEVKGYSLAKAQLINIQTQNNNISTDLYIDKQTKRKINDIVVLGYEKFPKGHLKNIQRINRNRIFTKLNLDNIYNDFNKLPFVKQTKYPEILFTPDSTKIYVYLEKAKSNQFDGFIGFSNDEDSKIIFNGYVDLLLQNAINSGEKIFLYWKNDGNQQATFNIGLEIPYLFKTPITLKSELNIFKQDSTFQNTKTSIDLGYLFNYNTRTYVGYQSTQSSTIQSTSSPLLSDFNNAFFTTQFEFKDFKFDDFLFPEKTNLNLKFGTGERTTITDTQKQYFISMNATHIFNLNENNSIQLNSENYYLKSDTYIVNELFRFGGIRSIRGFNENSLQGSLFTSLLTEYRYTFSSGFYTHTAIDYGYFEDKSTNNSASLLGLGIGFGLFTKNGLFNIVYANGNEKNQEFKLSNSIVHISFKSRF